MPPTQKKERKSLSIGTKIKILDVIANGIKKRDVCKKFNVKHSTLRTIILNEATIRRSVINNIDSANRTSCYARDTLIEKTEKSLMIWIEDNNRKKIPLNGEIIKEKALRIYYVLRKDEPSSSKKREFQASNGWLQKFIKRYSLKNVKTKGESASADAEGAALFPAQFAKVVQEGGYTADQVFNADESALFWKRMPSTTYTTEVSASGFKIAKERVTLMFCSNASGGKLMKPLLINNSLQPRALKNTNLNTLPVYWRANTKAWMTRAIFQDWFDNCFIPDAKEYLTQKGLPFKVLFVLDNASSHFSIEHPNVQFLFLPPNTTSLIQPLDQGIISVFKKYYVKQTFRYILDKLDSDKTLSVPAAWKTFTIRHCVKYIGTACSAVKKSTLNGCWRPIWPACVTGGDKTGEDDLNSQIIQLGKRIGGDGFSGTDVEALLKDESLDDEEVIAIMHELHEKIEESEESDTDIHDPTDFDPLKLSEGIKKAEDLCDIFIDNDPCIERAVMLKNEITACMSRYIELKKINRKQQVGIPSHDAGSNNPGEIEDPVRDAGSDEDSLTHDADLDNPDNLDLSHDVSDNEEVFPRHSRVLVYDSD